MENNYNNNEQQKTTQPAPAWGATQQQQQQQQPQYGPQWTYNMAAAQANANQRPKRRFRNFMKTTLTTINVFRGILAIFLLFMVIALIGGLIAEPVTQNTPIVPSFSVIRIEGTIMGARSFGDAGYDHAATVRYIRNLATDPLDRGILIYMNTPGGTIYHSNELYDALLEYKEISGRPVHVYMAGMGASGGYWISMAADHIYANSMTITGSIGVVSTLMDTSQLFENLGIRTVVVDTGEHKSTGAPGTEITSAQEAVFQAMMDEYIDMFVEVVASGRNFDLQTASAVADGRIFTARQALELDLIDEISSWETALANFETLTGVSAFYPNLAADVSFLGAFANILSGILPRTEADIVLSAIESLPPGVPLAIAPELVS